jgi:hypothetical protein
MNRRISTTTTFLVPLVTLKFAAIYYVDSATYVHGRKFEPSGAIVWQAYPLKAPRATLAISERDDKKAIYTPRAKVKL